MPPGAASGARQSARHSTTHGARGMGSLGNSGSRSERAGSLAGVEGGGRVGRVASTRVFVFNARSASELVDPILGRRACVRADVRSTLGRAVPVPPFRCDPSVCYDGEAVRVDKVPLRRQLSVCLFDRRHCQQCQDQYA